MIGRYQWNSFCMDFKSLWGDSVGTIIRLTVCKGYTESRSDIRINDKSK